MSRRILPKVSGCGCLRAHNPLLLTPKDPNIFGYLNLLEKFQVCLKSKLESNKWYMDSTCSKHMTGDEAKFVKLKRKDGGYVRFGDKSKAKIVGLGKVGSEPSIDDVSLVDGLKYNLISVSQLCDKGIESFLNLHIA